MRLVGHRFLSLYGLFVSCSIITRFIPIFGAIISGFLGPALAYVLPLEAALVLPVLSLLVAMTIGFQNLNQLALALFMFPGDFLGIWVFCKLRDRGMSFGALLAYWAIVLIFLSPVYVVSGLVMAQINMGIAEGTMSVLGVDPNAAIPPVVANTIVVVSVGLVVVSVGLTAWIMIKAYGRYARGMRLLFKRLDPIRMQLKQIKN
jgi:hypothetical protein